MDLTRYPGVFLTFEGGEGCGKSTQSRTLAQRLQACGVPVVSTREPGGTGPGQAIRELILDPANEQMNPIAYALMFAADRSHHVDTVIRPALADGAVVLCDRYIDSSVAYQGAGSGLDEDRVRNLSLWATDGLVPDATFFLDLPPSAGLRRKGDDEINRMEQAQIAFHETVYESFRRAVTSEPGRFVHIDATESVDQVADRVWAAAVAVITKKSQYSPSLPVDGLAVPFCPPSIPDQFLAPSKEPAA
jgi:dTMP kinase